MGTHPHQLQKIQELYENGYFHMPAWIADIGAQQLHHGTRDDVMRFLAAFRRGADVPPQWEDSGRFTGHIFEAAGFRYQSFDIIDAPFVRHFDLNLDRVPWRMRGRFDLVLNFGTTEHVMNQYNAFRTMHDLAKVGGLIYLFLIQNGYGDHGIIRYNDRFISLLIKANEYEVVWQRRYDTPYAQWRAEVAPSVGDESYLHDISRWMVLKKTSDKSFQPIVDRED